MVWVTPAGFAVNPRAAPPWAACGCCCAGWSRRTPPRLHWPIWLLSPITGALPLQHRSSTWRVTCHDTPVGPDCEVDEFGEARDVPATVH